MHLSLFAATALKAVLIPNINSAQVDDVVNAIQYLAMFNSFD